VFCVLVGLIPACGQELLLSSITGTITDEHGGVVPAAKVTLVNQGTGFTRVTQSDGSGDHLFNNLVTGQYSIAGELPGFKKYVQTGIDLHGVADIAR
jgi:hypothetical protein